MCVGLLLNGAGIETTAQVLVFSTSISLVVWACSLTERALRHWEAVFYYIFNGVCVGLLLNGAGIETACACVQTKMLKKIVWACSLTERALRP